MQNAKVWHQSMPNAFTAARHFGHRVPLFGFWLAILSLAMSPVHGEGPGGGLPIATTLSDFFQPGSQPSGGVVYESFVSSTNCRGCHDTDTQNVLPIYSRWQGSMMAQAARDPLFHACLAIANQDAAFAGDLCIRCHSPGGWISGRSEPTDGSALTLQDRDGIGCSVCHRMVDPVFRPELSPAVDASILAAISPLPMNPGGGGFVLDPEDRRRGPYANPVAPGHLWLHAPYLRSAELCGTCHDVSNPAFLRQADGTYQLTPLNAAHPTADKYDMFPLERTYSEWLNSDYARAGVDAQGRFGGDLRVVRTCQDCHMPRGVGKGCAFGAVRDDLAAHDFSGGNAWVQDMIQNLYPSENLNPTYLQHGKERSVSMLQRAATLTVEQRGNQLVVRVTNETGHKLPSGYPEGRRMWLQVTVRGSKGDTLAQWGRYDPVEAILDTESTKVYEIRLGLDAAVASASGLPEGEGFHFALNNVVFKDNRIPPRGFTQEAYRTVQAAPVAANYEDGQFWDETRFRLPSSGTSAAVTLYYQTASREFIEFLRDENRTNDAGDVLYEQWNLTGRSTPVLMANATTFLAPFATGDGDGDGRVDLADYFGFMECFMGFLPDGAESCRAFDFDDDLDVDLFDVAEFQLVYDP